MKENSHKEFCSLKKRLDSIEKLKVFEIFLRYKLCKNAKNPPNCECVTKILKI